MANEAAKLDKAQVLAGRKPDKTLGERHFPVHSLDDMLSEIRRAGGTGKLEIHFRDGQARGEAKWKGYVRDTP